MIIKDSKMGDSGESKAGIRYITLAPGQSEAMVPVAIPGRAALAMMELKHGRKFAIVDADSPAEGVTADLAKSLIDKGLCVEVTPAPIEAGTSLSASESDAHLAVVGSSDSASSEVILTPPPPPAIDPVVPAPMTPGEGA